MFNINKFLPMTRFKPQTSGIGSDRSTNWATQPLPTFFNFLILGKSSFPQFLYHWLQQMCSLLWSSLILLICVFKWANLGLFCLFLSFSHYNFNQTNWKNIDGMLGIRIRGFRMVGADDSTELWRPPINWFVYLMQICSCSLSTAPFKSCRHCLVHQSWQMHLYQRQSL